MSSISKYKNGWLLLLFIIIGSVLGSLIGDLTSNISFLNWMSYGDSFGLESPLVLDLGMLALTFAFQVKISIASILGIILAVLIYKFM